MSPTSYQTAPPRDKAGAEVYDRSNFGSIRHIHLQESPLLRAFLLIGTEKGTRTPTPYGHNHLKVACLPIPPPRRYNSFAGITFALEWQEHQQELPLVSVALPEPEHHLLPAFASLPILLGLANLLESAGELSL
jgi:hypothetical protein